MTTTRQDVVAKLQGLPPEDLEKVFRFVESLGAAAPAPPGRKGLRGRFAYLNVSLSAEDIAAARREAWANFSRDIPLS